MPGTPRTPILYVHHRRELGGAPASLALLVRALDRDRFEPHVYCPPGPAADLFRDAGATVHTGPVSCFTHIWASRYEGLRWLLLAREAARLPRHLGGLRRLLRPGRFAIVHLNDSPLLPAGLLAHRLGVPVVWHLRSALPVDGGMRSRLIRRTIGRIAAATIAITGDVADSFALDSEVVPNGVDLERFSPGPPETAAGHFGLPPGVPIVAHVGFLYPSKGFREVLQAAALLRARGVEVRFLLAGGAVRPPGYFATTQGRLLAAFGLAHDHEREARLLARELGVEHVVRFVPFTADPAAVYRAAAIVVAPSRGPELGRPVIEAAACGVPVVASGSRTGAGILVPGETGLLVDPGAPESLAAALAELLADPARRARMGASARALAETRFDAVANARRIEEVYERLR